MSNGVCPSCKRTLSENAKFCTECGSRIDFQMTRKELEDSTIQEKGGLQIARTGAVSNPFYTKCNNINDKIINPALAPLSEKKRLVFRNWEDIRGEEEEPTEEIAAATETIVEELHEEIVDEAKIGTEEPAFEERIISEALKVIDSEPDIHKLVEIDVDKPSEQMSAVPPVTPSAVIPEKKKNRIITSSIGGGFKKRAPQTEEVKEVTALFRKKGRGN